MKLVKNKIKFSYILSLSAVCLIIASCMSEKIANKSGAQLWAENCQHCHNIPSPQSFSNEQWVTIGMHMQTRALITQQERDKIVAFLQQNK
jgi:cytochrome c2